MVSVAMHAGGAAARRGRLIVVVRPTRATARRYTDALFAFGDNLARTGRGGQAAALRGEPNAVGIPTTTRRVLDRRRLMEYRIWPDTLSDDIQRARFMQGTEDWFESAQAVVRSLPEDKRDHLVSRINTMASPPLARALAS
jgi:hypothetical protein